MRNRDTETKSDNNLESPGQVLKAARQAAGLSVDQVATRLYLLCSVVSYLEGDDYDRIRGDTFARGYLRNYARLLGLSPGPLLQAFDDMRGPTAPVELTPQPRPSRRLSLARFVSLF